MPTLPTEKRAVEPWARGWYGGAQQSGNRRRTAAFLSLYHRWPPAVQGGIKVAQKEKIYIENDPETAAEKENMNPL